MCVYSSCKFLSRHLRRWFTPAMRRQFIPAVRTFGSFLTHSCGLTNVVCNGSVVSSVLVDEESLLLLERSVKPCFNKICAKQFLYNSKSSSQIPRIRFLNLMKIDPCSSFIIKSAIISPVEQYSIRTSLYLILSVKKKSNVNVLAAFST